MPVSAFARRGSNAASSSQMSRSSSSSNPGPPPPPPPSHYIPGYPTGSANDTAAIMAGYRYHTTGSPGPAAAGGAAMSNLSEFGSLGGGGPFPMGSLGRSQDATNSTNTSPSQSPLLGGGASGPSTFSSVPPGMTTTQAFPSASISNADTQSGYTNSTFSSIHPFASASSSSMAGQHTDKIFRETFLRRVAMLSYLKRCISIASYPSLSQAHNTSITPAWLDVIKLSKRDLEAMYEPEKMRRRTTRNYTLGCSIAPLLEYNSSAECTKSILMVFSEVESLGEGAERDKAKMKNFFKSSMRGTRRGVAGTDWETGLDNMQGGATNDLLGYHVTTITLYDVLMEMYHKFIWFLSQQHNIREQGSTTLPNSASSTKEADPSSVEAIPSPLTTSTLEAMGKIDAKVKKMLSHTCKELDALVRHVIREELASVDPMMARELGLLEGTSSADTSINQTNE